MSENLDKDLNELDPVTDQAVGDEVAKVEAESTVFAAPAEHKDKAPKKSSHNKKRIVSIIAATLALAVLVTGTLYIIKNFAVLTDDETPQSSSAFNDITLLDEDYNAINTVTVTNNNGEFKFEKKQVSSTDVDGNPTTVESWTVNQLDTTKLSDITLEQKVQAACNFVASREIDKLSATECGLDKPIMKIAVTTTEKSYTVTVGTKSPDGTGSYAKFEGDINAEYLGKIYLVHTSYLSKFDFTLNDLASTASIPKTVFNVDTTENTAPDGSYAYFDSLVISGKTFGDTVTVLNNNAKTETASLMNYYTTTPTERYVYAEYLSPFISIFSDEISVAGCYAFDINDETLKEFGLDDPDFVVTLTIKGESKTFKLAEVIEEGTEETGERYYAIIYDGATMIRKVNASNFANQYKVSIIDYSIEDLYMTNIFMYSIFDVSSLSFKDNENSYTFNISYTEDSDGNKTPVIKRNGKEVVTADFQAFYEKLVGVQCSSFELAEITAPADSTITFTFTDDTKSVIDFYNVSATEYQYSINGKQMGRIPASYYASAIADAFTAIAQ